MKTTWAEYLKSKEIIENMGEIIDKQVSEMVSSLLSLATVPETMKLLSSERDMLYRIIINLMLDSNQYVYSFDKEILSTANNYRLNFDANEETKTIELQLEFPELQEE